MKLHVISFGYVGLHVAGR